jgi:hypothetical protein
LEAMAIADRSSRWVSKTSTGLADWSTHPPTEALSHTNQSEAQPAGGWQGPAGCADEPGPVDQLEVATFTRPWSSLRQRSPCSEICSVDHSRLSERKSCECAP